MSDQLERHQQAKVLFQNSFHLSAPEQLDFLEQNCDDPSLRHDVLKLLESHNCDNDFLESPFARVWQEATSELDGPDPLLGQSVESFRLIRRIGTGGMGTVYLAEQTNPVRVAAIKVLSRTGPRGEKQEQRFQLESQVLARLQHPYIAHVYASGIHDFGFGLQCWFAMEFIDGQPLHHYIRIYNLSVEAKLALLLQICEAVQHAHDRGVIHRDLKPPNIVIVHADHKGSSTFPKVVDFGVALLADQDRSTSLQTATGEILGTLNYMSPEQVSGGSAKLQKTSDLYALAVIGFELLTGSLPHQRRTGTLLETIRSVELDEARHLSFFDASYRGDLDVIFSKALQIDPSRRYDSVQHFAVDIRRFLAGQPILARPESARYRIRKFITRNRALVGGVAATITALTFGLVMFAFAARRAQHAALQSQYEADKANAVNAFITNDFMMKLLANANTKAEEPLSALELVDKAVANVDTMFNGQPVIEAAIRNEVGTIYYNLGALQPAADQFSIAARMWEDNLGWCHPDTLKAANNVALCFMSLNRHEEAESMYRKVLATRKEVLGESDAQTLVSMNNLAELLRATKRLDEAEKLLRSARDIQGRVLGPASKDALTTTANLGSLLIQRGNIDEAKLLHCEVYETCRKTFGEDHIITLQAGSRTAQTLHRAGENEQALVILLPIAARFEALRGPGANDTIIARRLLARIYQVQENYPEAEKQLQQALEATLASGSQDVSKKIRRDLDAMQKRNVAN